MLKTVYSALAVTALLAGTASFAADQTTAPATQAAPVAATASTTAGATQSAPAKAEAKATVVKADHVVKTGKTKDAATPTTDASATVSKK